MYINYFILPFILFASASVIADVIRTDIEEKVEIAPGESYQLEIKSDNDPVELFWQTLSPEECLSSTCIKI